MDRKEKLHFFFSKSLRVKIPLFFLNIKRQPTLLGQLSFYLAEKEGFEVVLQPRLHLSKKSSGFAHPRFFWVLHPLSASLYRPQDALAVATRDSVASGSNPFVFS